MSSIVRPIRTIFFGTPEFAVPALEALLSDKRFEIVGVVTQPDRPVGRKKIITPSPVKADASEIGLTVLQPEKLRDEAIAQIIELKPKLAVVVAYGNLIPKRLLEAVPRGFVNIHPSLLPKHRGASPLTATILEGDKETGVCLMVLDEGMDHGPIIACRRAQLDNGETTESLRKKLTPIGADMLTHELVDWLDGKLIPTAQNHDQATFCKLIESDSARIDWQKPVVEIDRLVRAMRGVTPAWTMLDGKMLLVHSAQIETKKPSEAPGTVIKIMGLPAVAAIDGYLILNEIQLAGGNQMSGQAFLNGHKDFIGKILK